jgi:ATP-binding cassette subfamily F protein 3
MCPCHNCPEVRKWVALYPLSPTPLAHLTLLTLAQVRLAFALIVFHPPPLLLLDEVTTHVDFATVKALALALRNWSGAVVLITHDRWLSRVVVEGESLKVASGVEDAASDDEDEQDSSDEDELGEAKKGATWRVGNGKIKLMEKGMQGYVAMVERKVAKRMAA